MKTTKFLCIASAILMLICSCAKESVKVSSVSIDPASLNMKLGEKSQLKVSVLPQNAEIEKIIWTSADENIVSVDANGNVTAVAVGETVVTVNVNGITKDCPVTVAENVNVESITLDKNELSLMVGDESQLTVAVLPEEAAEYVVWSSGNESIATVSGGKVTAVAEGETVITASVGDKNATCKVVVKSSFGAFEITVENVKPCSAMITVVPPDDEMTYYHFCVTKATFDANGGADNIFESYDKGWWEYVAEIAQDGSDWIDNMQSDLTTGTSMQSTRDYTYYVLTPETEYVVYAYGIDKNGVLTTIVNTETFITPATGIASDNIITVNITKIYPNSIDATITTTNNDTYLVTGQPDSYVSWFKEADQMMEMAYDLAFSMFNSGANLISGDRVLSPDNFRVNSSNKDYYLVVFGFDVDEGVTTDLQLIPFKTAAM